MKFKLSWLDHNYIITLLYYSVYYYLNSWKYEILTLMTSLLRPFWYTGTYISTYNNELMNVLFFMKWINHLKKNLKLHLIQNEDMWWNRLIKNWAFQVLWTLTRLLQFWVGHSSGRVDRERRVSGQITFCWRIVTTNSIITFHLISVTFKLVRTFFFNIFNETGI